MGSPVSPANIYMEDIEELVLGLQYPIPTAWWKRCVDDVAFITKKDQVDILFNHINKYGNQIKLTMECPDNEGSTPSWTQMHFKPQPHYTHHCV